MGVYSTCNVARVRKYIDPRFVKYKYQIDYKFRLIRNQKVLYNSITIMTK